MPPLLPTLKPFWQTTDKQLVRLYQGNAVDVLKELKDKSVHCCVTSPPYFGLRDYGVEGQLGAEKTPQEFVENLVKVFREVRRVLRDDGTLWLNLGDSYAGGTKAGTSGIQDIGGLEKKQSDKVDGKRYGQPTKIDLPTGNLIGTPWKVAFALQDDGWILRSDIPWVKRGCMPESGTKRPAKSLEYVFMFSKNMHYYFDMEAIKPKTVNKESLEGRRKRNDDKFVQSDTNGKAATRSGFSKIKEGKIYENRNFRNSDMWFQSVNKPHGLTGIEDELVGIDESTAGYSGSHFAVFPSNLIRPMILAGTSEYGCCYRCETPWRRCVVNEWSPNCTCYGKFIKKKITNTRRVDDSSSIKTADETVYGSIKRSTLESLKNAESHEEEIEEIIDVYQGYIPLDKHAIKQCVVLDPFLGSGTTVCVALNHGRRGVGIDLSTEYLLYNAIPRIEGNLTGRHSTFNQVPREVNKVTLGKVCSSKREVK